MEKRKFTMTELQRNLVRAKTIAKMIENANYSERDAMVYYILGALSLDVSVNSDVTDEDKDLPFE